MGGSKNVQLVNMKFNYTKISEYGWQVPANGRVGPIKTLWGDEIIVSMKDTTFGQNWVRRGVKDGWFSLKNNGTGEFLKPYASDVYIIGKGTCIIHLSFPHSKKVSRGFS